MAQRSIQTNTGAWVAVLQRLLREVRSLNRAYARGEERTDQLVNFLSELIADTGGEGAGPMDPTLLRPTRRTGPKDSTFLLDLAAQRGVEKLEFLPEAGGAVSVRIDGGKSFHLPPTLAFLLKALMQDAGHADGDLVGWKSPAEIQSFLAAKLGRAFTKHTVEQLISRLRQTLQRDGEANPQLIMTHALYGWRFALRKQARL